MRWPRSDLESCYPARSSMNSRTARSGQRKGRLRFGPRSVVLAVLLVGALAEVGLSRLGFGNPRLVRGDAQRGYALIGAQTIRGPRGTTERINTAGFREREWSGLPPGRPLVVVLGHSLSYGVGVEVEQRWTNRFESSVRERGAPDACVLNLAVPGYALEQMLAVYDECVRPLAPDLLVVELDDASIRPMLSPKEPAALPLARWMRRSALFDFWQRKIVGPGGNQDLMRRALEDPGAAHNEPLWHAALERLEAVRAELGARGARLVFLHTPSARAAFVSEPPSARWSAWCAQRPDVLEIDCAASLRERMAPLAAEFALRGIDARRGSWRVDRLDASDFAQRDSACFFLDDPVHLTALGHEVVAARVAGAVAPLLAPLAR